MMVNIPEASAWQGLTPPQLIVLDSGVGGLNVLKTLVAADLKTPIRFIADSAWMPYGEKAPADLQGRLLALVGKIINEHPNAYLLFACNTASAVWESITPEAFANAGIRPDRIIDILRPTVALLLRELIHRGRDHALHVGLMATQLTVNSQAYPDILRTLHPDPTQDIRWTSIPCIGLAQAVEGKEDAGTVDNLLEAYLAPLVECPPDALIIGCTHYLILKDRLQAALPTTRMIDPSHALSYVVKQRMTYGASMIDADIEHANDVTLFATGETAPIERFVAAHLPELGDVVVEGYAV
jgi:glutamate racemase